jgi:hypothetical protein
MHQSRWEPREWLPSRDFEVGPPIDSCHRRFPMTPSPQEGVSIAPARATATACLQELFECVVAISVSSTSQGCVSGRRACPRVPASPKMYPSRTREESQSRHRRQQHMPICRSFVQAL